MGFYPAEGGRRPSATFFSGCQFVAQAQEIRKGINVIPGAQLFAGDEFFAFLSACSKASAVPQSIFSKRLLR